MSEHDRRVSQALEMVTDRAVEVAPGIKVPYQPTEVEKTLVAEILRLREGSRSPS